MRAINYMSAIMSQNERKMLHNAGKNFDWVYRASMMSYFDKIIYNFAR